MEHHLAAAMKLNHASRSRRSDKRTISKNHRIDIDFVLNKKSTVQ